MRHTTLCQQLTANHTLLHYLVFSLKPTSTAHRESSSVCTTNLFNRRQLLLASSVPFLDGSSERLHSSVAAGCVNPLMRMWQVHHRVARNDLGGLLLPVSALL
jgi:hypothetical protein